MEKRCAYPAGLTRACSGRKYRLDAGVKTSTIDTSEMSQITMPAVTQAASAAAALAQRADVLGDPEHHHERL